MPQRKLTGVTSDIWELFFFWQEFFFRGRHGRMIGNRGINLFENTYRLVVLLFGGGQVLTQRMYEQYVVCPNQRVLRKKMKGISKTPITIPREEFTPARCACHTNRADFINTRGKSRPWDQAWHRDASLHRLPPLC
jgi:hypothetical protein